MTAKGRMPHPQSPVIAAWIGKVLDPVSDCCGHAEEIIAGGSDDHEDGEREVGPLCNPSNWSD